MYRLIESEKFKKDFKRLSPEVKHQFNKQLTILQKNPINKGKILGSKWFRELKIKKFRVYFIVDEEMKTILVVGAGNKKDQQKDIKGIRQAHQFLAREEPEQVKVMDKTMKRLIKTRDKLRAKLQKELHWLEVHNENARNKRKH